jgi:hypothetical protein
MSNYIKKLEADYEKGKITKDEFINSTLDYYKNWDTAKYEKLKRDLKNNKDYKPSKPTASYSSNIFKEINYVGYGFWSYNKNNKEAPFVIGCLYLLAFPIGIGIFLLSVYPAFILRDFLYKRGFFEDTGFASIMFSFVAIYLPIYLLVKVIAKKKKEIKYFFFGEKKTKEKWSETQKKKSTTNVKSLEIKNKKSKLSRDEIIKRLKENKELYDKGILTKEEYEKENSKLKTLLISS